MKIVTDEDTCVVVLKDREIVLKVQEPEDIYDVGMDLVIKTFYPREVEGYACPQYGAEPDEVEFGKVFEISGITISASERSTSMNSVTTVWQFDFKEEG